MSTFECLANELLFDLFDYFSSVDLFHVFNGLNSRFDSLLIEYYQNNKHLDFRLILKEDLNLIRRRYLPLFINEIRSIYLSNDDTNPHEIDFFLSRLYPLHRFINLESITLFNIYSIDKIIRILNDLQHIPNLTHLYFKQCDIPYNPNTILNLINTIWSLSNLTHCYLDIISNDICHLIPPTVISCSLKHLSIGGFRCDLDNLLLLYEHTPYVEYLSVNIWDPYGDYPQLSLLHSLTTLKLKCETPSRIVQSLLRKIPNVINLTIEIKFNNIDGHVWQDIISKYLPKLKEFNLKMNFVLDDNDNIEQEIDRIIDSYRTPFWIDQHKWFVRCFYYKEDELNIIHLHTLPYRFKHFSFDMNDNLEFKSTCPKDRQYLMYNYVDNLKYNYNTFEDRNLDEIQFSNVQYLTLTLPYNDQFRLIVPQFDNLISLEIQMNTRTHDENDLIQLQSLLDQAPRLYYLKFYSWLTTLSKSEHKNKKVITQKSRLKFSLELMSQRLENSFLSRKKLRYLIII